MKCTIRDITINYKIIGEGQPILMLHGYYIDHRTMVGCMEPVFDPADGYKRIYLDLPGMGETKAKPWIRDADTMLDILIEFINTVIPDEPYLVAGYSYGGYLARGIIYRMAHRVDGLMLLCPMVIPDKSKRSLPLHVVLSKNPYVLSKLSPDDAKKFSSLMVVQSESTWQRLSQEILSGIKIADMPFLAQFRDNGYGFSFDVDNLDTPFAKPSPILCGRQDSVVGYQDAMQFLDNFERASFIVLDKAGHNLQIEQPLTFDFHVKEWLKQVKEAWP